MTWYCFRVGSTQADTVAENLLALARDPVSVPLLSPDVQIYRRREDEAEVFYFSPAAFLFFKPFIATYHGMPCDRPVATHDQALLRRMTLKSPRTAWQPIAPGGMHPDNGDFPH